MIGYTKGCSLNKGHVYPSTKKINYIRADPQRNTHTNTYTRGTINVGDNITNNLFVR